MLVDIVGPTVLIAFKSLEPRAPASGLSEGPTRFSCFSSTAASGTGTRCPRRGSGNPAACPRPGLLVTAPRPQPCRGDPGSPSEPALPPGDGGERSGHPGATPSPVSRAPQSCHTASRGFSSLNVEGRAGCLGVVHRGDRGTQLGFRCPCSSRPSGTRRPVLSSDAPPTPQSPWAPHGGALESCSPS